MFIQALYSLKAKMSDIISYYFNRDVLDEGRKKEKDIQTDIQTDFGSINVPSFTSTPRILSGKYYLHYFNSSQWTIYSSL